MTDAELDAMDAEAKEIEPTSRYGSTSAVECLAAHVLSLTAEVRRLRRGEFTPEEFQSLCHHRDEKSGCTRADFEAGCADYQRKLFGR